MRVPLSHAGLGHKKTAKAKFPGPCTACGKPDCVQKGDTVIYFPGTYGMWAKEECLRKIGNSNETLFDFDA